MDDTEGEYKTVDRKVEKPTVYCFLATDSFKETQKMDIKAKTKIFDVLNVYFGKTRTFPSCIICLFSRNFVKIV